MSLKGQLQDLVYLHPKIVRPEPAFKLVWTNPGESVQEAEWREQAQAEVDAICTSLRDWKPRA